MAGVVSCRTFHPPANERRLYYPALTGFFIVDDCEDRCLGYLLRLLARLIAHTLETYSRVAGSSLRPVWKAPRSLRSRLSFFKIRRIKSGNPVRLNFR